MAISGIPAKYIPQDNSFYANKAHYFIYLLMALILLTSIITCFVLVQVYSRPLPSFAAMQKGNQSELMNLMPFEEPNQLADTLLRFASKAASSAYTFDFVNYEAEIAEARPYFTEAGWADFRAATSGVIQDVVKKQLFVTGVVSGTPVIANQGPLPGQDYVWRIQIPFLATFQSANTTTQSNFLVILSIVRVPTSENPQGIGIDQFIMVGTRG